jgi:hypothetical protein
LTTLVDKQGDERIYLEADAVLAILAAGRGGEGSPGGTVADRGPTGIRR